METEWKNYDKFINTIMKAQHKPHEFVFVWEYIDFVLNRLNRPLFLLTSYVSMVAVMF